MAKGDNKGRPIIIKREEVIEAGSHGGAWKVAYADFVTAMMAFFLLMWLVNVTTIEQRTGLADYFSPSNAMARGQSGYGSPFGGHTPLDQGSLVSDRGAVQVIHNDTPPMPDLEDDDSDTVAKTATFRDNGEADKKSQHPQIKHPGGPMDRDAPKPGDDLASGGTGPAAIQQAAAEQREKAAFQAAAQQIKDAISQDPNLAELGKQLAVDVTPEGLRIQLLDADRVPMFPTGSTVLNERARTLLLKVLPALMKLPEKISISGHTDSLPYRGGERTNWELSADRANATRHLFADAGLPEDRVTTVTGRADRDPLLPNDPFAAANRRIAITVLRDVSAVRAGK